MFILNYKQKETHTGGSFFLLTEINQTHGEGILILTDSKMASAVVIDKAAYRLTNGKAIINAESIKDGEILPEFVTGTTLSPATPFIKREHNVRWAPISFEHALSAIDAFLKLEQTILGFREELRCLKEAVSGKKLFTFADEKSKNDRKETQ